MRNKLERAVVTGGAGFIGSNLVKKLVDNHIDVKVIDDFSSGTRECVTTGVEVWEKDLSSVDIDDLTNFFKGADVVFHMAARARVQPSIENPIPFNKANIEGTLRVLMAANNAGVKRVVYSASSSCYGDTSDLPTPELSKKDPVSPYGLQKYVGEQYCELFSKIYGLDTVSLRYFNVYGPGMRADGAYALVLAVWQKQFKEGKPLTITNDGNQRRDFTHVDDVVSANILAATHSKDLSGTAFNIGNGKSYSMNEVVDMIGVDRKYGEKRLEPFETLADNTLAKNILGWNPTGSLKEFIEKYF